ncbi:MAG: non-heme iron oxygenase ferredoxin subunit [Acidimicrobiia bacterium]|nr:non-heme iron oxygenase ferredoxin subunit [Acidimicrobiia bacterium]
MTRLRVATFSALRDGAGVRVDAGGHRLALFRVGGEVFALGDRCSHAEASLAEGILDGGTVECPRHGAMFDLRTGAALSFPATRPVPVYRAEVEGEAVFVEVGEESP